MPKLVKNTSKHPRSVAARFTLAEEKIVQEAANARGMSPAGFARKVILSAVNAPPIEAILLEKLCETQSLLKLFFGGLFAQLNEKDSVFTRKKCADAVEIAAEARQRQAAELLSPKAQTGEKRDQ